MFTMGEVLKSDVDAAKKALLPPPRPETDVATLLTHGGVIVVVGGRPSNFSSEQTRDPRFVFWHSTDPKAFFKPIPSNARGLFFVGGFISTPDERRIRKSATERGIFVPPGYLTTGAIKTILDKIRAQKVYASEQPKVDPVAVMPVSKTPPPAPAPPVAEEPKVNRVLRAPVKGELKGFVQKHGDPMIRPSVEAKRLLPLLEAEGLKSTFLSVENALRVYVTQRPKKASPHRPRVAADFVDETPVPVTPAPAPAPAPAAPPPPVTEMRTTADPVMAQIDAALQMADDMRTQADLLTESLRKIRMEVQHLRQAKQRLASAAREFLD